MLKRKSSFPPKQNSPKQVRMKNKLHDGLFYVRSDIEYTKVKCFGGKEDLRFNTRIIIAISYLTERKRYCTINYLHVCLLLWTLKYLKAC